MPHRYVCRMLKTLAHARASGVDLCLLLSTLSVLGSSCGHDAHLPGEIWSREFDAVFFNFDEVTLEVAGDVNGDGHADILLASSEGRELRGVVEVIDGRSGRSLWRLVGDAPKDHLGSLVADFQDIDLDGRTDFAIATWKKGMQIVSGKDGSPIHQGALDAIYRATNVTFMQVGPDIDGDGAPEFIVGVEVDGDSTIRVHSGRSGDVLWTFDSRDLNEHKSSPVVWWSGTVDRMAADAPQSTNTVRVLWRPENSRDVPLRERTSGSISIHDARTGRRIANQPLHSEGTLTVCVVWSTTGVKHQPLVALNTGTRIDLIDVSDTVLHTIAIPEDSPYVTLHDVSMAHLSGEEEFDVFIAAEDGGRDTPFGTGCRAIGFRGTDGSIFRSDVFPSFDAGLPSVRCIPDVDGDGRDDLVVAIPGRQGSVLAVVH
jgi:hypothetical protein